MDDIAYCKRHNLRISLSDGCPACDADNRECEHCVNYRWKMTSRVYCILDRPLVPCDYYEREPGADDE